MAKTSISIFFSIIFLSFILAPLVLMAIDDTADISCFYTISEEENKNGQKIKQAKLLVSVTPIEVELLYLQKSSNKTVYHFKNYPKPHLNLFSPPPEFI